MNLQSILFFPGRALACTLLVLVRNQGPHMPLIVPLKPMLENVGSTVVFVVCEHWFLRQWSTITATYSVIKNWPWIENHSVFCPAFVYSQSICQSFFLVLFLYFPSSSFVHLFSSQCTSTVHRHSHMLIDTISQTIKHIKFYKISQHTLLRTTLTTPLTMNYWHPMAHEKCQTCVSGLYNHHVNLVHRFYTGHKIAMYR